MSAERIKRFSAFGNCQSPNSRVAALTSMSLAPPKHKRQSSVDCDSLQGGKKSDTKDQQNAQLVVSALDLAVEERRLAQFRTRCLVQENPNMSLFVVLSRKIHPVIIHRLLSLKPCRLIFRRLSRSARDRCRGTNLFAV